MVIPVTAAEPEKQTTVASAPPSISEIGIEQDRLSTGSAHSGETDAETQWLYLDGAGQEFGPFVGSVMERLFAQEFFRQGRNLLVRQSSWCRHVPVRSLFPDGEEVAFAAPLGPPGQPEMPPGGRNDAGDSSGHKRPILLPTGPYKPPKVKNGVVVRAERPTVEAAELGMMQPPSDFRQTFSSELGTDAGLAYGRLKSFSVSKGFGFIESPECYERFGRDVFMHWEEKAELPIGTYVTFQVERNNNGMPQARNVRLLASPSTEGHIVEGIGVKKVPVRAPETVGTTPETIPEMTPSVSQHIREQREHRDQREQPEQAPSQAQSHRSWAPSSHGYSQAGGEAGDGWEGVAQ